MDDPLGLPLPRDPLQRIERFAYDLAWGAVNEKWDAFFGYFRGEITGDGPRQYVQEVWDNNPPTLGLMMALGYMSILREGNPIQIQLTEKTFNLLNAPPPVSIFVSYRRSVSSALALYIWSELRVDGFTPFLDIRGIDPGDEWYNLLERRVKGSNIFIVCLGPTTLESEYCQREIQWALETASTRIIPVLHSGFTPDDLPGSPFPELQLKNVIYIPEETAAAIYTGMEQLRGVFGLFR
ncbi:MAG: toll/interleukin-1 receptor domain-containing protein [Chloroflexi bacterium]|nr:toll/interleukin-1 receptor domain-containing protein [Chloroflexota bacterium]